MRDPTVLFGRDRNQGVLCAIAIVLLVLSGFSFLGAFVGDYTGEPSLVRVLGGNASGRDIAAAAAFLIGSNFLNIAAIILGLIAWLQKKNPTGKVIVLLAFFLLLAVCIRELFSAVQTWA